MKWAALGLVTSVTLAVQAQIPRQMELQQIVQREQARIVAAKANTAPQTQQPQITKPAPAAIVAVPAPAPPQLQQPQIKKPEPAAIVAIPAPAPRPLEKPPIVKPDVKSSGMVALPSQTSRPAKPILPFLAYDQTDNAFKMSLDLPADLRRVAVLPIAWEGDQVDLSQGSETLGPMFLAELIKTKKFEVVSVDPEALRGLTGRSSWTGAEILPADFFDSLQRVYGCNAVLFSQLTTFRGYAPLAVGWRMKLVEARTGQILWAVDKVFDAEQRTVFNQARRFHRAGLWSLLNPSIDWQIENSPRQFGQFTIAEALSTMPNRKEMTKVSPPATDVPSRRQNNKNLPVLTRDYGN